MDNYATAQNAGYHGQLAASNSLNTKASRIDSDVEKMLAFARNVNSARLSIMRHANTLGYFSQDPVGDAKASVSPISTNMQTAMSDLDRAIDGLHAALNLFE